MTAAAGTRTPNQEEHNVPEEVTPETGNTTANAAAPINWDSDDNPYVQRYREAQSHLTPVQQENARLRALEDDRDAWMALGEKHGVQFEIEQEQPGVDPELAALRQQVQAQEQWRSEVEAERQDRAYAEGEKAVRAQHDEWAKEAGLTLSDFDHDAIIKRALDSGANDIDDVKGVFDAYVTHRKGEREAWEQEYEQARKRPRVPTAPVNGQTATGAPNWSEMTPEEIDQYMAERVRSA